jgi:electron transfer flavoprotein alpha/beta subunit
VNIIVCAKVIPASSVTIEIDSATKRMVRKGVPHELDPAAACALEEGLRLMEKQGGTVTVVTMGIGDATIGIRNALAMGATSAILGHPGHGQGPCGGDQERVVRRGPLRR